MNLKIVLLIINNLRIFRLQGFKAQTITVGRILSPSLSPFCYRKTRRGGHAPSVWLNHVPGH